MNISEFDYFLPSNLIAQKPCFPRDESKMLCIKEQKFHDTTFKNISKFFNEGDVIVINNTKVIKANLEGLNGSKKINFTLHLKKNSKNWFAFAKPAKKCKQNDIIIFNNNLSAKIIRKGINGEVLLEFNISGKKLMDNFSNIGSLPLPPYIKNKTSNDDSNYQTYFAKKEGAEVPFLRPSEISGDHTTTAEVLKHALIEIGADAKYKFACCIYPAVPFLMISDVKAGLELLYTKDAKSTLAISEFGSSVWRAFEEFSDHKLKMIWPEHSVVRTQDLPSAFHDAGQFYWVQVEEFLKKPQFFTNKTYGIKIPKWRSHDIDTKDDWERAEVIYKALQVRENL